MFLHTVCITLFVVRDISVLGCSLSTNGNISELLPMSEMPPVLAPQNGSAIFENLFASYDKRMRPGHAGEPLDIAVGVGVLSITNIEEENMEFTADMYMRQLWIDSRLAFSNRSSALVLQHEVLNKLWLPDTYFENSVNTTIQRETRTVVLFGDGLIVYSQRATVTATAFMDFRAYPMDKQAFFLTVEAYGRDNTQLRYRGLGVELLGKFQMSEFVIVNQSVTIGTKKYLMGCFDSLMITFTVKRRVGYYFIKIYFPAILCTVVSWLAFWIAPRNIGDRVTVGITSLLTELFLIQSINEHMPHVSYIKAADMFLIVSFAFSFFVLLESVIVYQAASGGTCREIVSPQKGRGDETEETTENDVELKKWASVFPCLTWRKSTAKGLEESIYMEDWIDRISQVFFPSAYIAFLVGYFATYLL